MDILDELDETPVDEDNNLVKDTHLQAKSKLMMNIMHSRDLKEKKAPPKPRRLSTKLSASFFTPPSSDSIMSFVAASSKTNGSSGGSVSHYGSKPEGRIEKKKLSNSHSYAGRIRSSGSDSDYSIQVTPLSSRRSQTLTHQLGSRRHSTDVPKFSPPPPPVEPPSPCKSPAASPEVFESDVITSQSSATKSNTIMDTRSEHKLDVSRGSMTLTSSVSTEAMLKDLRRMNPTYSSDLSVNKSVTVDAGLTSPTSYTLRNKSPSSKRCSTNYPMAGACSPGSPMSPTGELIRLTRSGRSSVDSGTSSGPHITKQQPGHFVVVAIDFGTTFSGYAFSFNQEPNSIHMMRKWEGGDPGLINQKTPTCLLLEPDGKFHSFGFSARDFYHDLDSAEARKWLYFDKFKMTLHYHASLNHNTMITAANGEKFSAKKVFSHSLRFFRNHALNELSDQSGLKILADDVKWVLTVPAIWKQPAKQFMREASYEAGLASPDHPDQLVISLEPEAASIYCRRLRMSQLVPDCPPAMQPLTLERNRKLRDVPEIVEDSIGDHLETGSSYMVVDCGGGTVDITVHELAGAGGRLRELYRASGGPHGSIGVDNDFEQLLSDIFSAEFMETFKSKRPAGFVDLMIAFESRKRSASPYKDMPLNVSLPFSFIDYYKKVKGKTVEWAIRKYGDSEIRWSAQGMLRLTQEAMRKLFMPTILKIKEAVGAVMVANSGSDIRYLFLVGGFAESPLLQMEVRKEFDKMLRVIIPQDVGLSILKGAVLFGHDPTIIHVRISRMTYGVGVLNRFVKGKHPKHKCIKRDGIEWCTDVFDKFVFTDQPVTLGDTVTRSYTPAKMGQKFSIINVYSAEKTDVMFITDVGVKKCGTLQLDLTELSQKPPVRKRREIQARMEFGDTEIKVAAIDTATGTSVKANIDFLSN
ncbi:heat shock 70 kDa protein 12A-like isoform X2 [Watersipora subatra]|uniref:heat shock 70 kDa protein 12A-like isoform X2 n=1 Tax=Watersipora subatra TaxID=2589382 RepID=UPI00355C4507